MMGDAEIGEDGRPAVNSAVISSMLRASLLNRSPEIAIEPRRSAGRMRALMNVAVPDETCQGCRTPRTAA